MATIYPYLNDSKFLEQVNKLKIHEHFVKINVLSFATQAATAEISGYATGGTITIDGSSALRRTANVSMIAKDTKYSEKDIRKLLTNNKKIELLIGVKNTTQKYTEYPILWFPQGIFVIITADVSHTSQGITISLTLHDKMALLNGECGGVFPASVVFNQVEDVDETGAIIIREPTIYQIIQELVNHFGGQQLGKIIISDVPEKIKTVMKWTGSIPIYLYHAIRKDPQTQREEPYNEYNTNQDQLVRKQKQYGGTITQYTYGQDIGYILKDFTYPGELIGNAGDSVVTILDNIRNVLGNYEYFYDVYGNFRFQEIKNYLNTTFVTTTINNMTIDNYLVDYSNGESVYTFEDGEIIQSYSNSPQYQQIKNDFMVWGKRKTIDGKQIPIRYHLAIDKKPAVTGTQYKVFFIVDPDDGIEKAKKPREYKNVSGFPTKGEAGQYYYAEDTNLIYIWNPTTQQYNETSYTIETITTADWRTELYMNGVASEPFGLESNYYYAELKNEWPKLYDLRNQKFFDYVLAQPSNIDFFLDFIDNSESIAEFGVSEIGRRTTALVEDSVNCIFEPDNPDIVILESGAIDIEEKRKECEDRKQDYSQVSSEVYNMLAIGGVLKSAYEEIRTELYQYTTYNEQISLTTLPIYYFEPNTRITVEDADSGISGDYMIKSISLPLDANGMMTLSCSRALERI